MPCSAPVEDSTKNSVSVAGLLKSVLKVSGLYLVLSIGQAGFSQITAPEDLRMPSRELRMSLDSIGSWGVIREGDDAEIRMAKSSSAVTVLLAGVSAYAKLVGEYPDADFSSREFISRFGARLEAALMEGKAPIDGR